MYTASADYYDLIYSTFKDYPAEVAQLTDLLRRVSPAATSLLDVACGTGEHARLLTKRGFRVDGLDLDPAFLAIARSKNPDGRFFEADMSDFHLPDRYDAVLCLFSSIGYLKTLDRVADALRCFCEHLAPGGVIVMEPWFPPGGLDPARLTTIVGEAGGVRVSRTARAEIIGRLSRLYFDYEITDVTGTRYASEIHELGLFTTEEQLEAFHQAGLDAEHDPKGLMDRGLFIAKVRA